MDEKFCVNLDVHWPNYFRNFVNHCNDIAHKNGWLVDTVVNNQLKPHGRLIKPRTYNWYLRWDHEKYHNLFVLKWS